MRRRDFVNLLGSAAAAWPLTVRAQQPSRMRRVGVLLGNAEDREAQPFIAALREELVKLGWMEGRNVQIDIRSVPADVASMRRFVKELAALQPDLIVTESTPAAGAMLELRVVTRGNFRQWLTPSGFLPHVSDEARIR